MLQAPKHYSIPHDLWREGQIQAINWSHNRNRPMVIEAPTGTGKSAIASYLIHQHGGEVIVWSKDLQQQYTDNYAFTNIFGKANYECGLKSHRRAWMEAYSEWPTCEECLFELGGEAMKHCPIYPYDCGYGAAKEEAMRARRLVLNIAYAWRARWWRDRAGLVIFDEAHLLPKVISSLHTIEISDKRRGRMGLPEFPDVSGSSAWAVDGVLTWMEKSDRALKVMADMNNKSRSRNLLSINRLRSAIGRVKEVMAEDACYIQTRREGRKHLSVKPVVVEEAARSFIRSGRSVFMSATIGEPGLFLSRLGLDGGEFTSLPHPFPQENRQVFLVKDAPRMSGKSGLSHYQEQASLIKDILRKHQGQRGIILTSSWRAARMLRSIVGDKRIWLADGERTEIMSLIESSSDDAVVISPSLHNGVDLHDDLARFAVIAKVPFGLLSDPIQMMLCKGRVPNGRAIYDQEACQMVVQGCGRIVRHDEDYGTSYIIDKNWKRVERMRPQWFEVQEIESV